MIELLLALASKILSFFIKKVSIKDRKKLISFDDINLVSCDQNDTYYLNGNQVFYLAFEAHVFLKNLLNGKRNVSRCTVHITEYERIIEPHVVLYCSYDKQTIYIFMQNEGYDQKNDLRVDLKFYSCKDKIDIDIEKYGISSKNVSVKIEQIKGKEALRILKIPVTESFIQFVKSCGHYVQIFAETNWTNNTFTSSYEQYMEMLGEGRTGYLGSLYGCDSLDDLSFTIDQGGGGEYIEFNQTSIINEMLYAGKKIPIKSLNKEIDELYRHKIIFIPKESCNISFKIEYKINGKYYSTKKLGAYVMIPSFNEDVSVRSHMLQHNIDKITLGQKINDDIKFKYNDKKILTPLTSKSKDIDL